MYSLWATQHLLGFQKNNRSWRSRRVKLNMWEHLAWCVCYVIWLRNLLSKMELKQLGATVIQIDNKSAIELANNPVNHERSKHIDIRFHFIRDYVKEVWNCCMWQVRIKLRIFLQNRYRKYFSTNTRRWLAWQMVEAFKLMGEFCWINIKCYFLEWVLNPKARGRMKSQESCRWKVNSCYRR